MAENRRLVRSFVLEMVKFSRLQKFSYYVIPSLSTTVHNFARQRQQREQSDLLYRCVRIQSLSVVLGMSCLEHSSQGLYTPVDRYL